MIVIPVMFIFSFRSNRLDILRGPVSAVLLLRIPCQGCFGINALKNNRNL